jgi:hypothetical protein
VAVWHELAGEPITAAERRSLAGSPLNFAGYLHDLASEGAAEEPGEELAA